MSAIASLRQLPLAERLQLVEDLWDFKAEDQDSLPDFPAMIDEVRRRKSKFSKNPATGITWEQAKARICSEHA